MSELQETKNDNDVFSVIFDAKAERGRQRLRRSLNNGVIAPPMMKKKSKRYTRPVFKEPASKPLPESQPRDDDREETNPRHSTAHEFIDSLRGKIDLYTQPYDVGAIQPSSRTQHRIRKIVGKLDDGPGLTRRMLKPDNERNVIRREPQDSSESSVVTCSNLDKLAAKSLVYKKTYPVRKERSDLSMIRREVKQIVVETILKPPQKEQKVGKDPPVQPQEELRDGAQHPAPSSEDVNERRIEIIDDPPLTGVKSRSPPGLFDIIGDPGKMTYYLNDISSWACF